MTLRRGHRGLSPSEEPEPAEPSAIQPDEDNPMTTGTGVNLRKIEERLARKPLDEIATLIQGLTYGEMIELAQVMWKSQSEGSAVTQENLPALLYRWSKSRSANLEEPPSE